MPQRKLLRGLAIAVAVAGLAAVLSPAASAQGVLSQWKTVEPPPPPELKTVVLNPQKTALLVMDFQREDCGPGVSSASPRCIRALPKVKHLLEQARAHHVLVVFAEFPHMPPFVKEVGPLPGEPIIVAHANKFEGTHLDKILKDHGITAVITTGMSANGAVLFTAYDAAARGYKVIVPVDAAPAMTAYAEQSTIWGIGHDPVVGKMSTFTTTERIQF